MVGMRYTLTQADLLLLAGVMPIPLIAKSLPEIAPPISTMYRRLRANKVFLDSFKEQWKKDVMSRMPDELHDVERSSYFKNVLNDCREEVIRQMKNKAARYERLTQ
jgi:hypothetical protein